VTGAPGAFQAILRLLGERTGLSFGPQRLDSAELGIRRGMARAGVADLEQYRNLLEADSKAFDHLVVELTVGETYFFREPAHFALIRREILPEVRRRRGAEHMLRAWSAGCASGEEPYSLAMLLEEEGLGGRAHVLATDISPAALGKARQATYTAWSLRGDGAAAAGPYLRRQGERYVLEEKIRRRVMFEHLNMALDVYPSFATGTWGMDLILCRNVLIYFAAETIAAVARRLLAALAPGGWLLTGSADPPLGSHAGFETVITDAGVFYRRPMAASGVSLDGKALDPAPAAGAPLAQPGTQYAVRSTQYSVLSTQYPAAPVDPLAAARQAIAEGQYNRAADLTRGLSADAAGAALHVRVLANVEPAQAERACAEAVAHHALCAELHYLHAALLLELGRDEQAIQAVRRVIYLDRSLAVGHFTLGALLRARGDWAGARRAYRNARDLCVARPPDEIVPLSDGEPAGRLAEAAAAELALLDRRQEVMT
jgi:chemotaxis protein methyltransferase CheR